MISMSYNYNCGVTTVSKIISETCQALWECLSPLVLPKKLGIEEWKKISLQYETRWDFVNCIGAIDGKHVVIQVRSFIPSSISMILLQIKIIHINPLFPVSKQCWIIILQL